MTNNSNNNSPQHGNKHNAHRVRPFACNTSNDRPSASSSTTLDKTPRHDDPSEQKSYTSNSLELPPHVDDTILAAVVAVRHRPTTMVNPVYLRRTSQRLGPFFFVTTYEVRTPFIFFIFRYRIIQSPKNNRKTTDTTEPSKNNRKLSKSPIKASPSSDQRAHRSHHERQQRSDRHNKQRNNSQRPQNNNNQPVVAALSKTVPIRLPTQQPTVAALSNAEPMPIQ